MVNFSFEISENNPDSAYSMVREKFMSIFNKKLKKEQPPTLFTAKDWWVGNINISIHPGTQGSSVKGKIASSYESLILLFVVLYAFIMYGTFGGLIFLGLWAVFYVPFYVIANSKRKAIGPKLCKTLQGTNFQQY